MLRGSSGFYSYAIYEHSKEMPAFNLYETRIAFMLKIDKYSDFFISCWRAIIFRKTNASKKRIKTLFGGNASVLVVWPIHDGLLSVATLKLKLIMGVFFPKTNTILAKK